MITELQLRRMCSVVPDTLQLSHRGLFERFILKGNSVSESIVGVQTVKKRMLLSRETFVNL